MFVDVMNVDAAQYATISRQMMETGSYLEVYLNGADYLDKPPLVFWLSSLSFSLFGVSNFTFKLPAVLVILLGLWSTFQFTKLWYNDKKAKLASVITATTMAFYLITNDIRMDGMLMGFCMAAIWQLSLYLKKGAFSNLFWGALFTACAMMTKGPMGIVLIGAGLGMDILIKRDWKSLFKWEWILFLVLVGIFLIPMCYGLYQQFDLHPEKQVYGLDGPSGLRFFFWTQSFGRITGEIYWSNNTGPFYFLQTMLWDFQPWLILGFLAIFYKLRRMFVFNLKKEKEYISLMGFILMFIALSSSNYKLPHYVFPLFPFLAILCADFIVEFLGSSSRSWKRGLMGYQVFIAHLFFILIGLLIIWMFPASNFLWYLAYLFFVAVYYAIAFTQGDYSEKLVYSTAWSSVAIGFFLGAYFYPHLLNFQCNSQIGKYLSEKGVEKHEVLNTSSSSYALDFYTGYRVEMVNVNKLKDIGAPSYLICAQKNLEIINKAYPQQYQVVEEYPNFKVTQLKMGFLNPKTRKEYLKTYMILKKVE